MTRHYDEQDGFRKKTGERDFRIRPVGDRPKPSQPAPEGGWTLLDQVAGSRPSEAEAKKSQPAAVSDAAPAIEPPAAPAVATRPRFRSLLSAQPQPSTEAVSGAYNGTPLKSLLRRIAERQAKNRPPGFDAWR